jgi:excisionase family DNA binding protein
MRTDERRPDRVVHDQRSSTGRNSNGSATVPFPDRLTCTIAEACEATGLGRTKVYELIGEGSIETTRVGRRRLVFVRSLRTLLHADQGHAPR